MGKFDRQGKPLPEDDILAWAKLFQDPKYKIVEQTTLPNGKFVSTVWLGMCHSFVEHGDRHEIFETMVFPKKGNYSEEICERYCTEAEAKAGHQRIINQINNSI